MRGMNACPTAAIIAALRVGCKGMAIALGVIETLGMPGALAVADAMGKSADVQIVRMETIAGGRVTIVIRGATGAVKAAVEGAVVSLSPALRSRLLGYHIVPCPQDSLDVILPLRSLDTPTEVEWLDD